MIKWLMRVPIVALTVGLLAAGCASTKATSGSASAGPVEKHDLTVAAVPALDSVGLYIAQQRGLFAAQGLHVKIVPAISSETTISAQRAGHFDVTVGNYVSYILANATQGAKLHILAAGSIMEPGAQELVVPAGSPLHSISQLKGKTIGVNVLHGIVALLVSALLRDNGVPPSQVHFKAIPFPLMTNALKAHQVDAASLPESFSTTAEETIGAQPFADLDQGAAASLPISGYVVTNAWLRKYPKTAAAFSRAAVEGQRIADTNPVAVQQAMMTFTGATKQVAALMATLNYPLDTDPVLIQRVADLMKQFGVLKQRYNVMPMIH